MPFSIACVLKFLMVFTLSCQTMSDFTNFFLIFLGPEMALKCSLCMSISQWNVDKLWNTNPMNKEIKEDFYTLDPG